jgi:hypothetical protein
MKKTGTVFKGKANPKADVTIILADDTLVDLASGKVCRFSIIDTIVLKCHQLNGQKAFMTGKLKTRGNMMLATKLDTVLKVRSCLSVCFSFILTKRVASGRESQALSLLSLMYQHLIYPLFHIPSLLPWATRSSLISPRRAYI